MIKQFGSEAPLWLGLYKLDDNREIWWGNADRAVPFRGQFKTPPTDDRCTVLNNDGIWQHVSCNRQVLNLFNVTALLLLTSFLSSSNGSPFSKSASKLRKYTAICVRTALHAPLSESGKERRFHRMLFPHAKIVMLVLIVST